MLDHQSVTSIIEHMNDDHSDAVLLYAKAFGAELPAQTSLYKATMTDIDEYGIDLLCQSSGDSLNVRILYKDTGAGDQLESVDDARAMLVRMVALARAALSD